MNIWLYSLIGILALIVVILLVKIHILQKAAAEIKEAFADRLVTDTNTLIDISSNDKHMRSLANSMNRQLRKLRREQQIFQQGDRELKNAVTNISHDLRTPLTAICGYLDLLENEDKSASVAHYLEVIENRTELLKQLTEELFRYSIITSPEYSAANESVNLGGVLEESIAGVYAALKEQNITPSIRFPKERVCRNVNPFALSRIFSNLLANAIKYSDGDLEITLSEAGEITFTNTASGLNEVEVGKLFDRFYTVESARQSTGLGLTIARTLVEQMQGTITADYENSKLSICIYLPDAAGSLQEFD